MRRLLLLIPLLACLSVACGATSRTLPVVHAASGFAAAGRLTTAASPTVGEVLTTSNGTWTNNPTSFAYQWQRCTSSCSNIAGATASSYTVATADVGDTIRVTVTASNAGGSASQTSAPTGTVTAAGPGPTNTALPALAGVPDTTTFVAPQLAATAGTWTGSPTSYNYQWQDCNSAGAGCVNGQGLAQGPGSSGGSSCTNTHAADHCSYNLTANEAGDVVKVVVTATNSLGSTPVTVSAGAVTNTAYSPAWPNYASTGYQNAPDYGSVTGGVQGVANAAKLTTAAGTTGSCPALANIQSGHTYSFCSYTAQAGDGSFGTSIGCNGCNLTNVTFHGDLFQDTGDNYGWLLFCNGCKFDYDTFKPGGVQAPNLPPCWTVSGGSSACTIADHGTASNNTSGSLYADGDFNAYATGLTFTHNNAWGWYSFLLLKGGSASAPNLVQDNWLHDQGDCLDLLSTKSCGAHTDGIGMTQTGQSLSYTTINHNNMPFITDNTNDLALQDGVYSNLTITGNLFAGDNVTADISGSPNTNVTFTGNFITNYAQQWGTFLRGFGSGSGNTWAHNKYLWDPTGVNPQRQDGGQGGGLSGASYTSATAGMCWVPSGLSTTDYGGGAC